jgi:DNA/RNA endonuclease YhcR with UshA esterase domain
MNQGIALVVKTEKETVTVHLGPNWYMERLDAKIVKGDQVEVKGVRTTFAGKPVVIAAEVKKGDNVLVLRDANGVPVWSGWGRRR